MSLSGCRLAFMPAPLFNCSTTHIKNIWTTYCWSSKCSSTSSIGTQSQGVQFPVPVHKISSCVLHWYQMFFQIWYLLLSAALRQAEPAVESVAYRRQETKPLVQDSSKGEWLSLFISSILKREFENRSFFVEMVNTLLASDPLSFQNLIPKLVLSHVAPSRSPSRTTSSSRRSSYESEWMSHVHFQVDKVLVLSKQDVMLFFFTLIEALLDGELSQQPIRLNGLIGSFVTSTETLAFLIRYFETSVAAIENPDLKDMENLTYRQSFVPLVQILVSMTAVSYLSDTREKFNQILGTPLLIQVIRLLKICHEMQSTKDFKWSILEASLSRRDLLMVIANLCYKSLENQKRLGIEEGILYCDVMHVFIVLSCMYECGPARRAISQICSYW